MDDQLVVPHKLHPLGLDEREVGLRLKVDERLVIGEDLYLLNIPEIVFPLLDAVYYCNEFLVMNDIKIFGGL